MEHLQIFDSCALPPYAYLSPSKMITRSLPDNYIPKTSTRRGVDVLDEGASKVATDKGLK